MAISTTGKQLPPDIDVRRNNREWQCKARIGNVGANDPQDCDWPMCGCDPYADKVVVALQESGLFKMRKCYSCGEPLMEWVHYCNTKEKIFCDAPTSLLYTTRQYPCGCRAEGVGGIPAYCAEHGKDSDSREKAKPTPFEMDRDIRDAKRWRLILSLTTLELDEMNPSSKELWKRFVKGGWYTDDLVALIDAEIDA